MTNSAVRMMKPTSNVAKVRLALRLSTVSFRGPKGSTVTRCHSE